MIIHNPILTGSFTVNGTDVSSITSSAASLTSLNATTASLNTFSASVLTYTSSLNNKTSSFATTGSNTFAGIQTVNSNLVVTGSITAQTLVVQTVTSSVVYSSGSNVFGNNIANTQVFTGSMSLTGSLTVVTTGTEFQVNANGVKFGNVIGDAHSITGSVGISGSLSGTSATFRVNADRNLAIKYDTNIALSAQSDSGAPESLRIYADTFRLFTATTAGGLTERLTISNTGTATFSSSATEPFIINSLNATTLNTQYKYNNGTTLGYIGTGQGLINGGGSTIFAIRSENSMAFSVSGGNTAMSITSGGNVGIGTSSPTGLLDITSSGTVIQTIKSTSTSGPREATLRLSVANTGTNDSAGKILFTYGGSFTEAAKIETLSSSSGAWGDIIFSTTSSSTERMRITSGGEIVMGATTIQSGVRLHVYAAGTSNAFYPLATRNSAGTDTMFVRADGYGYLLASAWAYGSDIRLKENISDVQNGLNTILKLKPKHFDYIDGVKDNIGWIAQDVQEVIPQAVSINEMDKKGYLALKQEFIVPFLVKAIQEQQAQIEELKNK